MRHFSCDLCGKDLTPGTDARFVLRMEVIAATDPSTLSDDDLDSDHVEEMAQILAEMQPIVVEFAQRFRRESEGRVAPVALESAGR